MSTLCFDSCLIFIANSEGPKLKQVLVNGQESFDMYKGHSLMGSQASFKSAREKVLTALVAALEERFSNTRLGVANASMIIKTECWPAAGSTDIEG